MLAQPEFEVRMSVCSTNKRWLINEKQYHKTIQRQNYSITHHGTFVVINEGLYVPDYLNSLKDAS